jgi:hypothetical protein
MRKKQRQLLKVRYATDILSRYKLGFTLENIQSKLDEYKREAQPTDQDYQTFVRDIEDNIYMFEANLYSEDYIRKRYTLEELYQDSKQILIPRVKARLQTLIRLWKEENDAQLIQEYETMLQDNRYTIDDILKRIPTVPSRRVQQHLYARVQQWIQEHGVPLAQIAQDAQNIHTIVINTQTNALLETLRAVPVPKDQNTMRELMCAWNLQDSPVLHDIRTWANKSYVVKEGDFLYRNTLRSVWANIQTFPLEQRLELTKRLWEECTESVGMCAQGHISRLVNVFVGFDEAFRPKPTFQETMASLSKQTIPDEDKIRQANVHMDERHMATEEREAWLDALRT